MQSFTEFDHQLKKSIEQKVESITPSEDMFANIQNQIKLRKGDNDMTIKSQKRTRGIMIACAILVVTSATCFAASKIASVSGGLDKQFDTIPTESQMEKELGFTPKCVDEFTNGYKFDVVYAGTLSGNDDDKNKVVEIDTANFVYLKDGNELSIEAMELPQNSSVPEMEGEQITLANGQIAFYDEWTHKFKPADYVMTEQDKLDEANGTYVFSFGEDFDFTQHSQVISWEENNIRYSIYCYDDKLSKTELIKMSEEIVSAD